MDDGHDPLCDNAGVDRPDPDGYRDGSPGGKSFLPESLRRRSRQSTGSRPLKAQAVLARTYIYRLVDPGLERIREEELDIDCLSMREMEKKWGKEHFREYYGKIRTAVQETEGLVAEYDGELIEPFYCEASAGKTRELAAYPYICSVGRVREIWGQENFYASGPLRKRSLRIRSEESAGRVRERTALRKKFRSSSGMMPGM